MKICFLFISLNVLFILAGCKSSGNGNQNVNQEDPSAVVDAPKVKEKEDPNKYILRNGQAGPFKIGHEIPGIASMSKYKMRIEKNTRQLEDGPSTESATVISENDVDLVWLKPGLFKSDSQQFSQINEIVIVSPKYKTKEGIGIGSTIGEFQTAYPDIHVWYTYVSSMYVAETEKLKIQFILDPADYTAKKPTTRSEQRKLNLKDFKPEGKITRIRIIE
ncbi:MAG: hypothetical protein M3R25_10730 [Bacteroidota bacterium]|nr:hypothetical protein [Bacteroidota bacterium]